MVPTIPPTFLNPLLKKIEVIIDPLRIFSLMLSIVFPDIDEDDVDMHVPKVEDESSM